jgi:phosphonate degradation associated HDIG domain protein
MTMTLPGVMQLLQRRGSLQYGLEAVDQLQHALQCAALAEQAGEQPHTIAASLLHDLGHLLAAERQGTAEHDTGKDDLHQYLALPFLRGLFPDAVLEPIRLHVDAKRYLCNTDALYWASLSPASRHSLEQQGGVFSDEQAAVFMAQPYAAEAVRLRKYDDLAKVPGKSVPQLSHFERYLAQAQL